MPPDIKEFRSLIKTGKLFAVQKWIAEGKRISAPEVYWETPLRCVAGPFLDDKQLEILREAAGCGPCALPSEQ